MKSKLYVTTKGEPEWYAIGESVCEHCKIPLKNTGFSIVIWEKKKYYDTIYFCHNCLNKHKKYSLSEHPSREVMIGLCRFSQTRPKNVRVYVPVLLQYQKGIGNCSVYDSEKIISHGEDNDRTRLAGRESFAGATIGCVDKALIESKDNPVKDSKIVNNLLNKMLVSEDKKLLGDK